MSVEFHETVEAIRNSLLGQCEQVGELDRRTVVRVWRDWNAANPLPPKPHGSILDDSMVARLAAVRGSLPRIPERGAAVTPKGIEEASGDFDGE
jgi:hypothetical protein